MKQYRFARHLLIAFLLSVALYVVGYWFIESRRIVHSPWRVKFQTGSNGAAEVEIRQESLGLGPVRIRIESTNTLPDTAHQELAFDTPRPVPFPVPLGQCIFQDTTFLPGTVVLEISGAQIQMLRRALSVGTREFPWSTNGAILAPVDGPPRWTDTP